MKKRMISFLLALMLLVSLIPTTAVTANAASNWTTSKNAVKILTEMQGWQATPYVKDGIAYIGYGSLVKETNGTVVTTEARAKELYPNPITKEKAQELVWDHVKDTIDEEINKFTKKYNLDLTQNQHDALAVYSYRTGHTVWDSTNPLFETVRTGKTGNAFLNAIANADSIALNDLAEVEARMNLRLAEANMYLNGRYAYYRPSNFAYSLLVTDGTEDGVPTELIAYDTNSGHKLTNLEDSGTNKFLGWYVFDGKVDGNIKGSPITKLNKDTDGKKIISKFAEGSATAKYYINSSKLPTLKLYAGTFDQADIKNQKSIGKLKANIDVKVISETMHDGIKWGYVIGKNEKDEEIKGWAYLGALKDPTEADPKPIATATITATAGVDIMPGATQSTATLGHLEKGVTVNVYETKVEYSEHGNKTWGKISVTIAGEEVIGWINLDKADVLDSNGKTDSVIGKTGTIVNAEEVNIRDDADITSAKRTTLKKGTKVTILDTKQNGDALWGKVRWTGLKGGYTEGWVYMYYVEVEGAAHTNPGNSGNGGTSGTVKYTGVVTSSINLNVRKNADVYATKVGSLPTGTKINIYETTTSRNMKWGRIGENQWVCLTYVDLTKVENDTNNGNSGSTTTTEIQATVTSNTLDVMKNYNNNSQKVGSLKKGDVVTILERNTETTGTGTRVWGRFIKDGLEGWINLAYAEVKTVTNVTNPGNGSNTGNSGNSGSSNANGADAFIANCMAVNVREAAGTSKRQINKLNSGTVVKVYEKVTKDNAPWARITWNNGAAEGWVCMYYVEMKTAANGGNGSSVGDTNSNTISATGTVNSNIALNVRAGAGLGYAKIGTLNKGAKVTVYEQINADGMIWGRIPYGNGNGYVCMSYINVDASTSTGKGVMGTIARCFKAVNVRSNPGTNNALVATINVGSRVEVFEQRMYSNQYWGRVAQGWICMDYVLLDSELPPGVILDETQPTTEATQATTQATVPQETVNKDNEVLYTISGTAMDDLNVHNSASDTSLKVGMINQGEDLRILAVKSNNAELWGRIDQHATAGWVKMNTKTATKVYYHVDGYVNTDKQPVYADPNTGSTVKGTLAVNQPLKIEKMTVDGGTVYGWVGKINEGTANERILDGWIPMGRISDEMQDVIPVCGTETTDAYLAARTIGRTNAAIEAVDEIIGGKVVFKLKSNVKVYIGDIHTEAGYVWGRVAFDGMEGYIKLNAVNFEMGASALKDLKVRKIKDTSDGDNVLGILTSLDSFKICELSFDSYGNLWGKVSDARDSDNDPMAVLNGGYILVNSNTIAVAPSQAPIVY